MNEINSKIESHEDTKIFNNTEHDKHKNEPILDTRFQSFLRFYIFDLNNADCCDDFNNQESSLSKKSIIKVNDLYVSKVCICGNIVNIYESVKYYRLKIDDSTGCINVTLWKNSIFDEDSLKLSNSCNYPNVHSQFSQIYTILNSIQTRIKETTINNSIMYEPKQGDLVLIRAYVRCYRQRIELNAVSCIRVKSSQEELIHMILPAILSDKVYSIPLPTLNDLNNLTNKVNCKTSGQQEILIKPEIDNFKNNENFFNFVHKKLIQMSEANILDSSRRVDNNLGTQSCESFALFRFLKNNCPNEFKFVAHKQVLDALKELESRGLVYSCEDEFHYLPLN
ncbi:unnamed protein product [Brachionus calyciflorus]|uniref:CST complex subunit STN1 n=1 Tax=Brachionus calyciflorus TaxID=104777 RepID=A0A813QE20_9BILA|nr:unnamed protein product [Brachionus calyciflorus]